MAARVVKYCMEDIDNIGILAFPSIKWLIPIYLYTLSNCQYFVGNTDSAVILLIEDLHQSDLYERRH